MMQPAQQPPPQQMARAASDNGLRNNAARDEGRSRGSESGEQCCVQHVEREFGEGEGARCGAQRCRGKLAARR